MLTFSDRQLDRWTYRQYSNIDYKKLAPRYILAIIDRWKNKGYYPNEVIINNKEIYEKTILPIYKIYQQKLVDLN